MAKKTLSYTLRAYASRIEAAFTRSVLERIICHRKSFKCERLHIWCLGDCVEGERIFAGQCKTLDPSCLSTWDQVKKCVQILEKVIKMSMVVFPKVKLVGVIGNHGRIGRPGEFYESSNADLMVLENIKAFMERSLPEALEEGRSQV